MGSSSISSKSKVKSDGKPRRRVKLATTENNGRTKHILLEKADSNKKLRSKFQPADFNEAVQREIEEPANDFNLKKKLCFQDEGFNPERRDSMSK